MKPAFTLSFSVEGISLLHHADGEWYSVGSVSLDTPDLKAAFEDLRAKAFALENDLSCRVVLPDQQIRYLTVETEDLDDAERTARIEEVLGEATPYALSDLAYDTEASGTTTYVAAVAKETLAEAGTFTTEHGFRPVLFSAEPAGGEFPRIPDFQETPEINVAVAPEPESLAPEVSVAVAPEPKSPATEVSVAIEPEPESPALEESEVEEPAAEAAFVEQPDAEPADPPSESEEASFSSCRRPTLEDTEEETDAQPEAEAAEADSEEEQSVAESEADLPPATPVHPIAEPAVPANFNALPNVGKGAMDETERLTIFGARGRQKSRIGITTPVAAAAVLACVTIGGWALWPQGDEATELPQPETRTALVDSTQPENDVGNASDDVPQDPPETAEDPDQPVDPNTTDTAILDALEVEPTPVDTVQRDPVAEQAQLEATGVSPEPPQALLERALEPADDLYLASIDRSDLSQDALALPGAQSFDTDWPVEQAGLPTAAGTQFELDDRGLVTATEDGTLNPDGVIVYLGKPARVPPDVPVRFEEEPVVDEAQERLAGLRPAPRPDDLVESFERQQLGGRSLEELAGVRPKLRPESLQLEPQVDETPTALAVVLVPRPKLRPVAAAPAVERPKANSDGSLGSTAAVSGGTESGTFAPKSVSPKIPSSASVARQATLDNAINLRRVNLIGVYGTPSNRRALIRLPSGRYKKVKIGDRLDGGRVLAIGDSQLVYQKSSRNVTLTMPNS